LWHGTVRYDELNLLLLLFSKKQAREENQIKKAELAVRLEANKLAVLQEKERIKIAAENRAKEAAAEKKKAKDDEREKRKKEAEEEEKIKETRKKKKHNDVRQSFRQLNQHSDDEESTIEQIKIRLLDGPAFKTIPDEFKSLSVFHHPIYLIKDFSFRNVNIFKIL